MTTAAIQPDPAAGQPAPGPGRRAGTGRWLAAALVVVLLGAGLFGIRAWRQSQLVARIQAALPAPPDVAGWPQEMAERLAKARAQAGAKRPQMALAGIAELGRLYHANSFFAQAERCWRLLRAVQPQEARWCYYLSDLRRTAGDNDEMVALMAETAKLAPDYSPAWLHLGDMHLKLGQFEEARYDYEKRLALLSGDPYARLGLIRVALQQGLRAEARTLVERLVKDAPEFSSAHNLFAEMLAADGDPAAASRERWLGRNSTRFREADDPWLDELRDWCCDYERVCVFGSIESQTRRREQAELFFRRAIRLRPDDPVAYELLGMMYTQANDAAAARDAMEEALRQLPPGKPTVMIYVDLANAHRMLKQPEEAIRVIRLGMERLGEHFEFYDALGVALGDLGRADEAVAALRAAVAKNPNDTNSNYNLAIALLAVRRLDEAVVALHRSLTLKPTFPEALALLAQIEMDSGRWRDALKYLQPLYESRPEMPQARQLMALWHLLAGAEAEKNKDLAAAAQHYRDGLAILPDHPELQLRFGTVCLIQGRFSDAIAPLETYRRSVPNNPTSALFLGQAYAGAGRREEARKILTEGAEQAERAGNATTAQYCREILRQL